jgi:hypothetical protein
MGIDISFLNVTATLALLLMVFVTGSVAYLTAVEWRDRRRRDRDKRER